MVNKLAHIAHSLALSFASPYLQTAQLFDSSHYSCIGGFGIRDIVIATHTHTHIYIYICPSVIKTHVGVFNGRPVFSLKEREPQFQIFRR